MTYLCNDQLTRIRNPAYATNWPLPKTYRVGDRGEKNGMPYVIRAFGTVTGHLTGLPPVSPEHPRCVSMLVKFLKTKTSQPFNRQWVSLGIGDTNSFAEKLVPGRHRNPVFNR